MRLVQRLLRVQQPILFRLIELKILMLVLCIVGKILVPHYLRVHNRKLHKYIF